MKFKNSKAVWTIAVIAAVAVLCLVLSACGSSNHDANIDTGVVIDKSSKRVTILEDDGERDVHNFRNSKKCLVGQRWPDCKK